MITNRYQDLKLAEIVVQREDRQRRKIEVDDLAKSIAKRGVLNPIIVTRELLLVAGERRLEACKKLGLQTIPARFVEELNQLELQIIELEENIRRKDLDWPDLCRSIAKIHNLYLVMDSGWTMAETAEEVGLTSGTVSIHLRVFAEIEEERILKAGTLREAYNIITRRDNRLAGEALQELLETPDQTDEEIESQLAGEDEEDQQDQQDQQLPGEELVLRPVREVKLPVVAPIPPPPPSRPPDSIICASFLDWVKQYSGQKFNLVHCDFPYGVELFAGPQGLGNEVAGYEDSKDTYFTLLEALCQNLDKIMSVSSHLMFWYSGKHYRETMETFSRLAPSLSFSTFPLIWVKSDNAGIASDPRHGPRHVYETCLLASRGKRQVVQVVADAYSCPTDKRLHVSTKPEPMLKHFMTMLVDDSTRLLDPTAGSGAALRAAEGLGANQVLGLEIDEKCCQVANLALNNARLTRRGNQKVKELGL